MPSLYTSLPHWLFTGVNNSEVEILDYDPTVSSIYFYTVQYSELSKKMLNSNYWIEFLDIKQTKLKFNCVIGSKYRGHLQCRDTLRIFFFFSFPASFSDIYSNARADCHFRNISRSKSYFSGAVTELVHRGDGHPWTCSSPLAGLEGVTLTQSIRHSAEAGNVPHFC